MNFVYKSKLRFACSLLICFAANKLTSKKIKLISSLIISFLIFVTSLNATDTFAQQERNFQSVNKNKFAKSEFQKTISTNGEVEQEWVAIYNGVGGLRSDEATDIAVDSFGNVYVTGYSQGLGYDYDCATIKYGAHGEVLWISRYDGGYDDYAYKFALDDTGNVYITGYSVGSGTGKDCLTIKYNTDGVEQWVKKYNGPGNGDDSANDIALDDSRNVYITGYSAGSGTNMDYIIIKYNSEGIEQWVKRYNGLGNSYDEAEAISIDNLGNILVTGRSIGLNNRYNYLTIKYNTYGVELWVQRYTSNGNYSDIAYDITTDGNGNIIVTGGSPDSNSINVDYLTVKYDSSGTQLWTARYNGKGNSSDLAYKVAVDILSNVYVTGYSLGEGGRADYATIKYDSLGNELWSRRFNGGIVHDLTLDKLGSVYVTGNYFDSTTIGNYITIKYDAYGLQQWLVGYNGPGNGLDGAVAMTLDQFDNIYITGLVEVQGGIPTFDYATIKYKQRVVPVELTNFTASKTNNCVILYWQTATETNNAGFGVERLQDSKIERLKDWKLIDFVPGFGTTSEPKSYSFEDCDLSFGVYYYRLKQIDFDGSFEYSEIIEVLYGNSMAFSLEQNFPNPFNSVTTINYSIAEPSFVFLKVYNTLGEEVARLVNGEKDPGKYSLRFNAQGLPSGVYLYRLNTSGTSGEYNFVKKFVLLK
ncbi:MAG: hypothetical protein B6D44_06155 [Ignavibacteriales bacterium UTCHB2]|jgi:hypothetical protein|nr:MAG: hypothetical protein B6D44_06155 [Ignavibacteriales bacterium UTCHB2]